MGLCRGGGAARHECQCDQSKGRSVTVLRVACFDSASAKRNGPSAREAPGPSRFGARGKGTFGLTIPSAHRSRQCATLPPAFALIILSQDIPGFPKSLGCRLTFKLRTPSGHPRTGFFISGPLRVRETGRRNPTIVTIYELTVEEGSPLMDPRAQSGHRRCKGDHEDEGAGETHHQHARHYGRDQINRSWSLAFADQVEVPTVAFIPISMKVHDSSPRVRA